MHSYIELNLKYTLYKFKNVLLEFASVVMIVLCGQSYARELDNPYNDHMIPEALKGQRDMLFGNLEEIYNFHSK